MNENTLQILPGRNDDARLVVAIQCAKLYFLLREADSTNRQITHTDNRADDGQKAGGAGRCDGVGAQRDRNQAAGEVKRAGSGAGVVGNQGAGIKA